MCAKTVTPRPVRCVEDQLLIKADKNPNSFGVRERFGSTRLDAAAAGQHDLVLIWGEWQSSVDLGDCHRDSSDGIRGGRAAKRPTC